MCKQNPIRQKIARVGAFVFADTPLNAAPRWHQMLPIAVERGDQNFEAGDLL